jgi:anti-sigma regulatory factor (Ser/Thr protein kinase)
LRDQLDELIAALQLRGGAREIKLTSVLVAPLLQQAAYENEVAALMKGVRVRTVPSSATIESDALLLGTVLRNLVSNAIKYTQPGGRVLVGCRHHDQRIRIDVYDTGIGITGDQMPRMFEAFTRLDPARCDGLGIGLFIVRQAIGILGHRIDVASTPCRGSRFSIFASDAEWKWETSFENVAWPHCFWPMNSGNSHRRNALPCNTVSQSPMGQSTIVPEIKGWHFALVQGQGLEHRFETYLVSPAAPLIDVDQLTSSSSWSSFGLDASHRMRASSNAD